MRALGTLALLMLLLVQSACVNTSAQAPIKTERPVGRQVEAQAARQTSPDAVAPNQGKVMVIGINGLISKNALEKVRQSIGQVSGDPIPAGLIVLLDSAGGDGVAAMQIGRLLRKANAHVFVTGECASACIFVLASGVVRVAPSYSVGIHRGRVTMSDANAKNLIRQNVIYTFL